MDRKICYYFTDEEFLLPEERLVALAEDACIRNNFLKMILMQEINSIR